MPLGLTKLLSNSTRLRFPSKLATSTVSLVESVQYMFREIQSTANPSGDPIPYEKQNMI